MIEHSPSTVIATLEAVQRERLGARKPMLRGLGVIEMERQHFARAIDLIGLVQAVGEDRLRKMLAEGGLP